MTMLKLVDETGEILGAIIMPDVAVTNLFTSRTVTFYGRPSVTAFPLRSTDIDVADHRVVVGLAHSRDDAVMLYQGTLYEFERVAGCFFIPGYASLMKGRR